MAFGQVVWPSVESAGKLKIDYTDAHSGWGMEYLPMNTVDQMESEVIKYDVLGHVTGMTQGSLLGAPAKLIPAPKLEQHILTPTYWKDAASIGEKDIIKVRKLNIQSGGDYFKRGIMDLWLVKRWQMLVRLKRRLEWTVWQAFENAWAAGVQVDEQYIKIDYGLAAATTVATLWTDYANSDPVADIQTELMGYRGAGVHYVDILMNLQTALHLCRSEKLKDSFAGTPLFYNLNPGNLNDQVKQLIQGSDNKSGAVRIRRIEVYEGNYQDSSDTTQLYIPDGRVHFIGGRDDAKKSEDDSPFSLKDSLLGEWLSTPALHGMSNSSGDVADVRPGVFIVTKNKTNEDPPHVHMKAGIHGAPAIYHRNWLKRLQVTA